MLLKKAYTCVLGLRPCARKKTFLDRINGINATSNTRSLTNSRTVSEATTLLTANILVRDASLTARFAAGVSFLPIQFHLHVFHSNAPLLTSLVPPSSTRSGNLSTAVHSSDDGERSINPSFRITANGLIFIASVARG